MGPLGWWVIASVVLIFIGLGIAVVAGASAVMHFPDELDPDRNDKRFVGPAIVGVLLSVLGMASLVIAIVCIIVEAVTAT